MGLGFLNIITIIFVIAKLFGMFPFSWLIVFLPTIIDVAIILICFLIVAIVALVDVIKED